jgi:3-hydroxyacyl-CoA dehydrogenase/enoyl-CoA hydratase/3-hydroxybutyryl-CoA epimerase
VNGSERVPARDEGRGTRPLPDPGVTLSVDPDGIAHLVFDRAGEKVNVLNSPMLAVMEMLLDRAARDGRIAGLVIASAKPGSFIAGADVREIGSLRSAMDAESASRRGQRLFRSLEDLPFPVVAAINGTCLGGGTELALACHFRVAADSPKTEIGLPEVRLGILPGWGGTQRLPRLVGIAKALDLILTGRSLDARRALRIGLVDEVAPPEYLLQAARRILQEAADGRRRITRGDGGFLARLNPIRAASLAVTVTLARRRLAQRLDSSHYPAPFLAIQVIEHGLRHGREAGFAREAEAIGRLALGSASRNLMALFLMQQATRKDPGIADALVSPREVRHAVVVGAGAMGGGIAQALARAGITVRLKDIDLAALTRGMRAAHDLGQAELRKKRIGRREFEQRMARIQPTLDYTGMRRADIAIEAVVESMEIKRRVLRDLEAVTPEGFVFATNTSSLPIGQIAAGAQRPRDVVGMHFFNPVHKMPLVEVIRGPQTSDAAVATAVALARRIGKTPVVVGDAPGFLVNRILMAYLGEALVMLEEGSRIEEVDRVMVAFGMPMGPFALLDQIGIDVAASVAALLSEAYRDRAPRSVALQILKEKGWLGRKSGRGFYLYGRGGHDGSGERGGARSVNAEMYRLISTRDRVDLEAGPAESRLVLPMINEASRCLESGVVRTPADVDLGMVMGTGFPPFRGGLLRHADSLGLAAVVHLLEILAERHGPRFLAARLLLDLAREGRRFYEA